LALITVDSFVLFPDVNHQFTGPLINKIFARKVHYWGADRRRRMQTLLKARLALLLKGKCDLDHVTANLAVGCRALWHAGSPARVANALGIASSYPAKAGSPALTSFISAKIAIKPFQSPAMDTKR
jgi:hypothetical protein